MEILILVILTIIAFIGYTVWKSGVFHQKSSPKNIDDVINQGRLYQSLNKHMEELGARTDTPLAARMSRFLWFGTDVGRQAAGISTPSEEMGNGPESAAVVMFAQQGIHTLMTLEEGEGAINTSKYKNESAKIFELSMMLIFGYKKSSEIDSRGEAIVRSGVYVTKIAQKDNEDVLQYIFTSWDNFLHEVSDETITQMGEAMKKAVNLCQELLKKH